MPTKVEVPVTFKVEESQAALATVMPEEEALPKVGVIKVGEVARTARPVPVVAATNKLPEAVDWTMPAVKEDRVVEAVTVNVPLLVVVASQVRPEIEIDVPEAVPRIGVTKVGEVAKTACPVPVLVVT